MLTDNTTPARSARPARSYAQMPRFQRVKVSVLGRYMLADRREFPCQILEMSPGDAVVIAPVAGSAGEKVVAYLDHIGRIEGSIVEWTPAPDEQDEPGTSTPVPPAAAAAAATLVAGGDV